MLRFSVALVCVLMVIGCNGVVRDVPVLKDSETFLIIPAGISFKARDDKEFVKESNMWVVHPGYLQKLQEEANLRVIDQ